MSATLDFIGKAVNFLVLFGGLAFLLRKPLSAMLAKRSADIRETLRLAEASRSDAAKKREESAARLSGLDEELRRMMTTAEDAARREQERIAGLAAEEARRLRKFTEQAVAEQVRSSLRELKAHAAERATSLARTRILKKLTPEDQSALIDRSIERLARVHEKPNAR